MDCQFGEKTYETHMNIEWGSIGTNFAPNPRLEKVMGVDSIFYIDDYPITVLGSFYNGVILTPDLWKDPKGLLIEERIPNLLMNLFIQYKTNDYISRSNGKDYSVWGKPYYRHYIKNVEQLDVLCDLENKIGNDAFVAYAFPACWETDVLLRRHEKRKVVVNSNYAFPSKLRGHSRYTFTHGGAYGRGFSEESIIEKIDLQKTINRIAEIRKKKVYFIDFINETYKSIYNIMNETKGSYSSFFSAALEKTPAFDYEYQRQLDTIFNFCRIVGISWQVLGQK